jgi:putative phage-type endonuclease
MATDAERKAAWLDKKVHSIGGTDAAAILGLNRYRSPIQVWLEKKGLVDTVQENDAMRWGKKLERPILEAYSDMVGHPVTFADPYEFIQSKHLPVLGCSLDARWQDCDHRPVDAKNTRQRTSDWGDPGSDVFPVHYQIQLCVQMHVTDTPMADLAVLFSGSDLQQYTIHRDMDLESAMLERLHVWWQRHIVEGIQPDADGSDSCTKYIRKRFARSTEKVADATPEVIDWVRRRKEAVELIKVHEEVKAEMENLICAYLGDAEEIPGVLSWKNNKDSSKTDEKSYIVELEAHLLKAGFTAEQIKGFRTAYTIQTKGARVLRFQR